MIQPHTSVVYLLLLLTPTLILSLTSPLPPFGLLPSHPFLPPTVSDLAGRALIPPPDEHSRNLHRSLLYVYEVKESEGGGGICLGCVKLDEPTPFTVSEMLSVDVPCGVGKMTLFVGGDEGGDRVMLLNGVGEGGEVRDGQGVFVGGFNRCVKDNKGVDSAPTLYKFIFNSLTVPIEAVGEGWTALSVRMEYVLENDLGKGEGYREAIRFLRDNGIGDEE